MTTTVQSIIKNAQILLLDVDGVRWPATELIDALNAGQRDIATLRPDQFTLMVPMALAAGARQALPANCAKLIEVPRNTAGGAIRQVSRNLLDAISPTWYTQAGVTTIQHFCHDPREPGVIYVYPPAASVGASVDLVYNALPADVPAVTEATYTGVTGNVSVPDVFVNALLHFVLFRAFGKDAETGNAALSASHYQLFKAGLSDDLTTRQAVKPTVTDTPQ